MKELAKCIHKIDITSLALNINTPLEEPFSLDILTDNILYLDFPTSNNIAV